MSHYSYEGYFQNRPGAPANTPWIQTGSSPEPARPTNAYQPSSPMMMISQPQMPFTGSPQGYFIQSPGQQCPVTSGAVDFYPGTNPAEYPAYAGAYYPAQPQYFSSVQPAPVMINLAEQQQQTPISQQPLPPSQGPPKTDRKQVSIRDPTQGGRDITEEIMSGVRWFMTTPTPPQSSTRDGSPAQSADELTEPDDEVSQPNEKTVEPQVSAESSPPLAGVTQDLETLTTLPLELAGRSFETVASDEVQLPPIKDERFPSCLSSATASHASSAAESKDDTDIGDTGDDFVSPSAPLPQQTAVTLEKPQFVPSEKAPEEEGKIMEEVKIFEKGVENAKLKPVIEVAAPVIHVNVAKEEMAPNPATEVSQQSHSDPESAEAETQDSEPKPTPVGTAERTLPQDSKKLSKGIAFSGTTALVKSSHSPPSTSMAEATIAVQNYTKEEGNSERNQDAPSFIVFNPREDPTVMQATFVPKKRRNMKQLNKKEAIGHLLDAFTEKQGGKPAFESSGSQDSPVPESSPKLPTDSPAKVADETWEDKEGKQNTEPDKPKAAPQLIKQRKTTDPGERKWHDRDFPPGFQPFSISLHKQKGSVVLHTLNRAPLRPADPAREMNIPDFTPSYLRNLGSKSVGRPRLPPPGLQYLLQDQRKETKNLGSNLSHNNGMQLNKAENAWRPSARKSFRKLRKQQTANDDTEQIKTQQLFKHLRGILNKLTPEKFQELIKQVQELTIDTEERLKGVIDLIFEKAILEPNFSVVYANMCHCFRRLKVPITDKTGFVNFCKVLLNRCQEEFEKDRDDDEILEKKQKELKAAKHDKERERLRVELEEARDKMRHRSLGNIKFIGELFKMKMLTASIMDDCIVKLLKNHDEESLECLCRLLSTIGKNLDFKKAKLRMDQYFYQIERIVKERKTSSRIRFMLQDVLDLRKNNWVPRRRDQGPKTIDQIHKEAKMEEQLEQIEVHQQLLSRKEAGGRMGDSMGGQGPHTLGGSRTSHPQDEGWNTITRLLNVARLRKAFSLDWSNQALGPEGSKNMSPIWAQGCSGGSGEQDSGRITTSFFSQFSVLQRPGSLFTLTDSDRRVTHRPSLIFEPGDEKDWSDRDRDWFERFDYGEGWQVRDGKNSQSQISKRSFIKESQERGGKGRDIQDSTEPVRHVSSMTDDRGGGGRDKLSGNRSQVKDPTVKCKSTPSPPSPPKPALTEEELERKSTAIIEEYLHINDLKEALQCVTELNSALLLYVFVRHGIESTLDRRTPARERIGLLLYQLVKAGTLPKQQFYRGLEETLEAAEDTAIDIPHIWLYLAELITPMLHEGGISMGQLFREIAKPLLPQGKAGMLLVEILQQLCKEMSPEKVGAMWSEAGLKWSEFLPENEDVHTFVTDQKVEFTVGVEESAWSPLC